MINGIQWEHICSRTGRTLEDIAKVIYPGSDRPLPIFMKARRSGELLDEMDIAKLCAYLCITPNELLGYENFTIDKELIEMKVEAYRVILDKNTGEVRVYNRANLLLSEMLILDKIIELGPYLNDLVAMAKHREKYCNPF